MSTVSGMSLVLCADGIYEMPQPLGLFAGDLRDRANEYLLAYKVLLAEPVGEKYPGYFLAAHCLELLLKAFVVAHGTTKKECRTKFGHDLEKLLDRCEELDIPDVPILRPFTLSIHAMNRDFDFRYPSSFILHPPPPKTCVETLEALHATIKPVVDNVRSGAKLQWASDTRHLQGHKIRWSD